MRPVMLVGRRDILVEAEGGLAAARSGVGSALLLSGEPGVGKTRVAQEVARIAVEDGFMVLWSSCWDGGGSPALWPWIQLLRAYEASTDPDQLKTVAGPAAPHLARVAPGFGGFDAADPIGDADAEDRFRLFDALASFLDRAAGRRPLCLVLDDVHWADPTSLELLRFVGSRLAGAAVYVLAARRSTEPAPGRTAEALDELATAMPLMELHGLDRAQVAELFESVTNSAPADRLVATIHERSGGNPLFVRELARLLAAQGRLADPAVQVPAIPAAVQSVIGRRVGMLGAACRSLLEAAAVLGVEFDARLAADLAVGESTAAGHRELAEAVRAGVVLAPPTPGGRHRFVHGLVRDVLYTAIDVDRRASLHRRAAGAFERSADSFPDELLEHYERAGTPADLERALEHADAAAAQAFSRLAFEESAAIAGRGLAIAGSLGGDDARRLRLLQRRGDALNRAGDPAGARAALHEAAEVARRTGDVDALADAAIGCGYVPQLEALGGMGFDPAARALLEEALQVVPRDSVRGVLIRWRLAQEIAYLEPERVVRLTEEAVEGARRVDDPVARGRALELRYQLLIGGPAAGECLEVATEIHDLGRDHQLPDIQMRGHVWRTIAHLQLGDLAAVDREITATERLITDARLRVDRWYPALWRAMRALLEGRIEDAERLAEEALVAGEAQGQGAIDHYGMQLMAIRREQGRMDELIDLIHASADHYPEIPAYRCALAMAYAETGRIASAQAELDLLGADGFAAIPDDYNKTVALMTASIACVLVGDADHAAALIDRWKGFEQQFTFVGYGAVCGGAISFHVGALAATAGRTEDALDLLEDALARNRAAGATLWTVRTEASLGRLLVDRDPGRAAELLARARSTTAELGLTAAAAELDAIDVPPPAEPTTDEAPGNAFRQEGQLWAVTFGTLTVHVPDAKGMHDLALLLASPGQEVHALQLYAGGEPVPAPAASDPVIDDEAARQYRDRITDLQEEIDDAEAMADSARAERARLELDALTEQLTEAYGLGGRPRKGAGDPAERARKAVTARVRDSIKRIGAAHPELGTHLERSVNTGTFLSYTPDRPTRWTS